MGGGSRASSLRCCRALISPLIPSLPESASFLIVSIDPCAHHFPLCCTPRTPATGVFVTADTVSRSESSALWPPFSPLMSSFHSPSIALWSQTPALLPDASPSAQESGLIATTGRATVVSQWRIWRFCWLGYIDHVRTSFMHSAERSIIIGAGRKVEKSWREHVFLQGGGGVLPRAFPSLVVLFPPLHDPSPRSRLSPSLEGNNRTPSILSSKNNYGEVPGVARGKQYMASGICLSSTEVPWYCPCAS